MISLFDFMRLPLVIVLATIAVISAQPQDPSQNVPIRFGSGEPVLAVKPREFQIELPNISDPLVERRPRQNQYVRQPHIGQVFHQPQQQFYPQPQAPLNNRYASQRGPVYIQPQYPRLDLRPQPYRPQPPPPQPQVFRPPQPQTPQYIQEKHPLPLQPSRPNKPLPKPAPVYIDKPQKEIKPIPKPQPKTQPVQPTRPVWPQPPKPHRPVRPRPHPVAPPSRPIPPKVIKTPNPVIPARPQPRPQPPREQYKEIPPPPVATRAPLPPATLAPQPRPWPRTSPVPYIEPVAPTTEHYQPPEPEPTRPAVVRPKATTSKPQTTAQYVPPATTPRPRPTTTRPRPRPTTTPRATTTTPRPTTRPATTTPRPTTTTPRATTTTPRPTTTTPKPTTTTPRPTTTTPVPTTTTPKPAPTTEEYEPAAVEKVYDETYVGQYYYGKRGEGNNTFPLPSCFYNPSGYVCCNLMLNELMTTSFEETRTKKISNCNVQKIANKLQRHTEKIFSSQFETIVSYEDFSQKIHFRKDLVCKIEIDGRFILAYATPNQVEQEKIIPTVPSIDIVKDSDILKQQVLQKVRAIDATSSDL